MRKRPYDRTPVSAIAAIAMMVAVAAPGGPLAEPGRAVALRPVVTSTSPAHAQAVRLAPRLPAAAGYGSVAVSLVPIDLTALPASVFGDGDPFAGKRE
jgi:hypothetical protein